MEPASFCPWYRAVLRFQNFLWHTWTDQSVPSRENSLLLLQAFKKAGKCGSTFLSSGSPGIALGTEETQGIDQKYLAPYWKLDGVSDTLDFQNSCEGMNATRN